MRTLLIICLFVPLLAISANPDKIDVTYSMKGENLIMTWSSQQDVVKYIIEAGDKVNKDGEIEFSILHESNAIGKSQVTYNDASQKSSTIVYYKITGFDSNNQEVSEAMFTANFTNKEFYTVHINPNFYTDVLEFEINTREAGEAVITVENLNGNFKTMETKNLENGYNSFLINVQEKENEQMLVKIDYNNKVMYRMIEVEGGAPAILTSDE